jgi:hypothetical protein
VGSDDGRALSVEAGGAPHGDLRWAGCASRSDHLRRTLDTDSGEVRTGRICPANRGIVRAFLMRLAAKETVVAVEAMTGWRFIAEEMRPRRHPGAPG